MIQQGRRFAAPLLLAGLALVVPAAGAATEILALVNDEPITLDDYYRALGEMHAGAEQSGGSVARKDPTALLDRLINAVLLLQEARAIGLDEVPAFGKAVEAFREEQLRGALVEYLMRDVHPPDAADVQRRYAERMTELEVSGVRFEALEDAQTFVERLAAGQDFESLARDFVARGKAGDFKERAFLRRSDLAPGVVEALSALTPGSFTGAVSIGPVFAVVKLYGSRLPEDAAAREEALREARESADSRALADYVTTLEATHAKLDLELLETLDLDAAAGEFSKLLEDPRELVRFDNGPPIRVSDLAGRVQSRMFHGVEQAARGARLNRAKRSAIQQMISERVVLDEAVRLGIDRTPEFSSRMMDFENSMLFGQFVARVLDPSITVGPDDVRRYYDEHAEEFTEPAMIRLDALAFADAAAAQRALEHLNAGADRTWMRTNAAGQVAREAVPEALRFAGQLVTLASLDAPVREALTGAGPGDHRIYEENAERYHVLVVLDLVPARVRVFDAVRGEIERRLFGEKREEALADWTRRLREASTIEVRYDAQSLDALLTGDPGTPGH